MEGNWTDEQKVGNMEEYFCVQVSGSNACPDGIIHDYSVRVKFAKERHILNIYQSLARDYR